MAKIVIFGSTGKLGREVISSSLEATHQVTAFVRNAKKLSNETSNNLNIFTGNLSNCSDISKAITGQDIVISCLGNIDRKTHIMDNSFEKILNAAKSQNKIPRCVFITSLGCSGTSFLVKAILILIMGKKGFQDYENADKRITNENKVPCVLVRPAVYKDTSKYKTYAIDRNKGSVFQTLPRKF